MGWAFAGAHHLGRAFAARGHTARLMSPEYVRPKAQKNDNRDAILLERGIVVPQGKRKLEQFLIVLMDEQGGAGFALAHDSAYRRRTHARRPGPRRRALLMASLFGAFPFLIKLYADGGYQGQSSKAR
jgi:hypothetical protein